MPTLYDGADTNPPESDHTNTLDAALEGDTSIDPDVDVVIKSEWHFITDDLRQELALLRTDAFGSVVFENARETVEEIPSPTIFDRIVGLPFFFLGTLYTDSTPLIVEALKNDVDVRFTRDSDGDVIEDLPSILPSVIIGIVLTLGVGIAWFGALTAVDIQNARWSLACYGLILATPIAIRYTRGILSGDVNRNEIIANRIHDAVIENSGRVFAPVGAKHAKPVRDRLPDDVTVEIVPSTHGFWSVASMKEFIPGIVKTLILIVAVWIAVASIGGGIVLLGYGVLVGA